VGCNFESATLYLPANESAQRNAPDEYPVIHVHPSIIWLANRYTLIVKSHYRPAKSRQIPPKYSLEGYGMISH